MSKVVGAAGAGRSLAGDARRPGGDVASGTPRRSITVGQQVLAVLVGEASLSERVVVGRRQLPRRASVRNSVISATCDGRKGERAPDVPGGRAPDRPPGQAARRRQRKATAIRISDVSVADRGARPPPASGGRDERHVDAAPVSVVGRLVVAVDEGRQRHAARRPAGAECRMHAARPGRRATRPRTRAPLVPRAAAPITASTPLDRPMPLESSSVRSLMLALTEIRLLRLHLGASVQCSAANFPAHRPGHSQLAHPPSAPGPAPCAAAPRPRSPRRAPWAIVRRRLVGPAEPAPWSGRLDHDAAALTSPVPTRPSCSPTRSTSPTRRR